jgi:hypothetical protein
MGRALLDVYDEDKVSLISQNLAAAIEAATFGEGSWDQVPAILCDAFPGSIGSFVNMNFSESRVNFYASQNIAPAFISSYAEHFAAINPWAAYWGPINRTTIAASGDAYPARSFANSEFYNDWLLPQGRAEAAVGMKLVGGHDEAVHFTLNYALEGAVVELERNGI